MYIYIYIHIRTSLSIYLSLSMYIYIYICFSCPPSCRGRAGRPLVGPPAPRSRRAPGRRPPYHCRNPTTSFLTAAILIYAIGAGITTAAGTRLALQSILVKGCKFYSFQLHTCHILPPSEIDLGLCLAAFAGSGGKYPFHRIG